MAKFSERPGHLGHSQLVHASSQTGQTTRHQEEIVKKNLSAYITTITLFAVLTIPVGLAAQDNQDHKHQHHRYKLVDLGTFGGPQSYFNPGSGYQFGPFTSLLNSHGTVAGFADTSKPDPFGPDFCFWDCYVVHAFEAGSDGGLKNLGALGGGGSSVPTWIAANGLVAGLSENGETDPLYAGLPVIHAVLWQQGKIKDLGTLPGGGYQSQANSVNSAGKVVGSALNTTPDANTMQSADFWLWGGIQPPYQYQVRAFLWDRDNEMQDLGTLPGGTDAQALLINERGQVVGHSYTGSTPSPACLYPLATDSFIWEQGKGMVDLGSLGGTCTLVTDLNNRGQAVGGSNLEGDTLASAFLWENGDLQALGGSLGGSYTGADAINEVGEAVGYGYLSGDATYHATLWKNAENITDLGVIGNDQCSFAAVINARGEVAGSSIPVCGDDDITFRAVLWEDGSIFDLNSLIPPDSALYLADIYTLNDRGEMAGRGVDASGNEHAFLLIPCDGNHPSVEGCDYNMVDVLGQAPARPSIREVSTTTLPAASRRGANRFHFPALGPRN